MSYATNPFPDPNAPLPAPDYPGRSKASLWALGLGTLLAGPGGGTAAVQGLQNGFQTADQRAQAEQARQAQLYQQGLQNRHLMAETSNLENEPLSRQRAAQAQSDQWKAERKATTLQHIYAAQGSGMPQDAYNNYVAGLIKILPQDERDDVLSAIHPNASVAGGPPPPPQMTTAPSDTVGGLSSLGQASAPVPIAPTSAPIPSPYGSVYAKPKPPLNDLQIAQMNTATESGKRYTQEGTRARDADDQAKIDSWRDLPYQQKVANYTALDAQRQKDGFPSLGPVPGTPLGPATAPTMGGQVAADKVVNGQITAPFNQYAANGSAPAPTAALPYSTQATTAAANATHQQNADANAAKGLQEKITQDSFTRGFDQQKFKDNQNYHQQVLANESARIQLATNADARAATAAARTASSTNPQAKAVDRYISGQNASMKSWQSSLSSAQHDLSEIERLAVKAGDPATYADLVQQGKDRVAASQGQIDAIKKDLSQYAPAPSRNGGTGTVKGTLSLPPPTQGAGIGTSLVTPNTATGLGSLGAASGAGATHHSQTQPRTQAGQFNGPPASAARTTPRPAPTPTTVKAKTGRTFGVSFVPK